VKTGASGRRVLVPVLDWWLCAFKIRKRKCQTTPRSDVYKPRLRIVGKAAKTVLSVLLITSLLTVLIPEASLLAVMMSDNALYNLALTYSLPIPYSQHFWRLDLEPYHVLKRSGVLIANTKCTQSWTRIGSIHGLDWILLDWARILRKLCGLDWVRWLQSSVFFSFMYFLY